MAAALLKKKKKKQICHYMFSELFACILTNWRFTSYIPTFSLTLTINSWCVVLKILTSEQVMY